MNLWMVLLLALFILWAVIVWVQLGIVSLISPEMTLIVLGALGFGLFAFRLLAGYVTVIQAADAYLNGEFVDRNKLSQKGGKSPEEIKELPLSAVLALILAALEPYRYTYYFGFTFMLMLALALGLLPLYEDIRTYVEALFWGSALTTFFVWAFESFASTSVEEVIEREQQEEKQTQTSS